MRRRRSGEHHEYVGVDDLRPVAREACALERGHGVRRPTSTLARDSDEPPRGCRAGRLPAAVRQGPGPVKRRAQRAPYSVTRPATRDDRRAGVGADSVRPLCDKALTALERRARRARPTSCASRAIGTTDAPGVGPGRVRPAVREGPCRARAARTPCAPTGAYSLWSLTVGHGIYAMTRADAPSKDAQPRARSPAGGRGVQEGVLLPARLVSVAERRPMRARDIGDREPRPRCRAGKLGNLNARRLELAAGRQQRARMAFGRTRRASGCGRGILRRRITAPRERRRAWPRPSARRGAGAARINRSSLAVGGGAGPDQVHSTTSKHCSTRRCASVISPSCSVSCALRAAPSEAPRVRLRGVPRIRPR